MRRELPKVVVSAVSRIFCFARRPEGETRVIVLRLLIGRILLSLLTLFLVSCRHLCDHRDPTGDVASRILGRDATPEALALLREKLHLNDPAILRYLRWLGGMLQGDFGNALTSSRPIADIVAPRLFNTGLLSLYAFVIYIPLALIPALMQAVHRDRPIDQCFPSIIWSFCRFPISCSERSC